MVPRRLLPIAAALCVVPLLAAAPADAAVTCSLHASPSGSDAAAGTLLAPLRTVQGLANRLQPGQTGCLGNGDYVGNVVIRRGGAATKPLTITALTPRGARIRGQLRIDNGANYVTIADLRLDGTNPEARPSPLVNGDDARFLRNDVTSAVETCFVLGDKVWGVADRTVIAQNEIHHCGVDGTNQDHGVYVRQARDTRIDGNVIRDNPDRGVQLFPNADRTVVRRNLITANGVGVIFSGDSIDTSDSNVVDDNVITYSDLRHDVEAYWYAGRIGTGNVVRGNCIWGGLRGAIQSPQVGFTATGNFLSSSACSSSS